MLPRFFTIKISAAVLALFTIGFFLFGNGREMTVTPPHEENGDERRAAALASAPASPPQPPPASSTNQPGIPKVPPATDRDIEKQLPLLDPPDVVKGVYVTSWSAGSARTMERIMKLIDETELNAIVIDIKDYTGMAAYKTDVPAMRDAGAERDIRILKPNALIKALHDRGIYVIARIAVFQDQVLTAAHPEWALKNKSTGAVWRDRKGLAWLDPSVPAVWDYHVSLARDALSRGFDEINFDYIRFASDGDIGAIAYPVWNPAAPKAEVIAAFSKYLRDNLPGAKISADLFGLTTVENNDLGIGQEIQSAYQYFDYVSPMVYPSHYASGFLGYANPAQYPYEVIAYSLDNAVRKFAALTSAPQATSTPEASGTEPVSLPPPVSYPARLRPWLQDFDLGAVYDEGMIRKEIQAVEELLIKSPELYAGWLLWDPSNAYTSEALLRTPVP